MDAVDQHRARTILPCHCLTRSTSGGAGISTCSPSPTAFALGLGPDLPWVDEPSPGNLGPSTPAFLARVSLLIPAFSLVCAPAVLSIRLLRTYDAPLPTTVLTLPSLSPSSLPPAFPQLGFTRGVRGRTPRIPFVSPGFAGLAGRLRVQRILFPPGGPAGGIYPPRERHCQYRRPAASVSRLSPGHLRR